MDTRKIQSVGGGTYTVSLPKAWAEAQGLSAGDTVNLHTHVDDVLAIQAREDTEQPPGRVVVEVGQDDVAPLEQTLRAAYTAGASEVVLRSEATFTAEQRRAIDEVVRNLTGISVVEESDDEITAQTPLDPGEVSVRQSVRQLSFVARSMHRDATAVLTDGAAPESLLGRDEQADRLYALIERSFVRGLARLDEVDALGLTRPALFELWLTARELERVGDHAEQIAALAADGGVRLSSADRDRIETAAQAAREAVSDAVGVVVGDRAPDSARRALRSRDRVRAAVNPVDGGGRDLADADARSVLALERVRRTAEHGGNIAEIALQGAVRRGELSASDSEAAAWSGSDGVADDASPDSDRCKPSPRE
ncbi:PhoU domain-containing protein [Halobellus sp. GM3]|uniref:PhoU domain-containing protein n=1 Tax=Halobellus sp. GM3 TaxID=3458410 RepID=UPI00403DD4C6